MKKSLVAISMLLLFAGQVFAEDPVAAAKKYAALLAKKQYAEALKLLTQKHSRTDAKNMELFARNIFNPGFGVTKVDAGDVIYSNATETHALALFQKRMALDARAVSRKAEWDAKRDEDFPQNQRAAAARVIRMEGSAWLEALPVYLEREVKYHTRRTEEGEPVETRKEYGPWLVNMKGDDFPFREFRGDIKKKFGANILRYGSEDSGEAGCHASVAADCYPNEEGTSPKAVQQAKCYLESGAPCPEEGGCFHVTDEDNLPCKKGQKGCMTIDGETCFIR